MSVVGDFLWFFWDVEGVGVDFVVFVEIVRDWDGVVVGCDVFEEIGYIVCVGVDGELSLCVVWWKVVGFVCCEEGVVDDVFGVFDVGYLNGDVGGMSWCGSESEK